MKVKTCSQWNKLQEQQSTSLNEEYGDDAGFDDTSTTTNNERWLSDVSDADCHPGVSHATPDVTNRQGAMSYYEDDEAYGK